VVATLSPLDVTVTGSDEVTVVNFCSLRKILCYQHVRKDLCKEHATKVEGAFRYAGPVAFV